MHKPDIIIVGAGIVGAALACALGQANLNILLLDSQTAPDPKLAAQDLRVSAITYGNQLWLKALGVWDQISEAQVGLFRSMRVTEQRAELTFDSADIGIPTLGYIVPNQLLNNALLQQLTTMPQVEIQRPVTPMALNFSQQEVLLSLAEQQVAAKLIIGADGAQSWVREQCQFGIEKKSYAQHALVAQLQVERPHHQSAYQQFKAQDILAFLPLADARQCSLVWSASPEKIQMLKDLSLADFATQLNQIWGPSLGEISVLSERKTFPLTMRHTQRYLQERVALMGDAAHTIHPLAGQGLNLGLQDAQCLAEVILAVAQKGRDIGRYYNLRPFERRRRWHNTLMLQAVASNKWLFAQDHPTLTCLRSAGMQLLNTLMPLKKEIMHFATFGPASRLAKF